MHFSPYWITTQKTWPVNWVWKVWKIPETAACVYPAISPETLTRSSANESATSLKTGVEVGWGEVGEVSVVFDKSHSHDEIQLPNFSSNIPPAPHGPLTFQGGLNFAQRWWELSSPGCCLNSLNGHPANCAEPQKQKRQSRALSITAIYPTLNLYFR